MKTGTRSVGVPRTRSAYALFGIPHPREVYNLLSGYMHEYVEAPHLMDMKEGIRELVEYQKRMAEEFVKKKGEGAGGVEEKTKPKEKGGGDTPPREEESESDDGAW